MTEASDAAQADRTLKARHRAMWALGDYQSVASHVIPDLGAVLVEECSVRRGDRVLDIAAGSGNAAIPAALAGPTSSRPTSPPNCWRSAGTWPPYATPAWSGGRPTPSTCPSRTASSTW